MAGFGASGRNGGWCSALFPTSLGEAQDAAMRASVDEVQRVALAEGIDCHFAKGGTIVLARNKAQLARARAEYGDQVLSPAEAGQLLRATRTLGATYTPDCAAIHPGRLVRGLAEVVTRHGVSLHERTAALSIEPGVVRTRRGSVRAPYVVRATEGFTPRLPGLARAVVPVYSLIVATEPLAPEVWDEIGLARRETFSDHRHLIIYGQRTADDRLVFGGRGAPYHLRSRISPAFDRDPRVFAALHATLLDLFPVLRGHPVHPRLGRAARHPARLVRLGGAGPRHRAGLGRRLRRRRRLDHQPGRPDALRPDPRPVHRADRAPLGRPPVAVVGARTAALARHQRRAARDDAGRRRGAADRAALGDREGDGAAGRRTLGLGVAGASEA